MRILATSREALRVAGEVRVPVAPLLVREQRSEVGRSAAVELFLERARAARPGFELDAEAVRVAEEIARRLDGLPLAIELAAARVNVLGLGEIVAMLERRAALLRDGPAGDPARTALQGLVAWSYDLLHGDEKKLVQLLAVHRGGASLRSLVAMAASHGLNEATVAYLVGALVDKSIVSATFTGGAARYDMLDTVREYVLERLAEAAQLGAARGSHAEHFAALAEEARVQLRGPEWLQWERRLELENDNLWAALSYAADASDPLRRGPAGTLGWYFGLAGRVSEGRRYVDLALAATARRRPGRAAGRGARRPLLPRDRGGSTSRRHWRPANVRSRSPRPACHRDSWAWRELTLALALAQAGREERVDAMAREAAAALEVAGDDWGVAASSLIRGDTRGARRRRLDRRRDGGGRPPSLGRDRLRRLPRPGAAARGVGRPSGARTARPRWRRTGARSSSRAASGSATTRRSLSPGSGRTRSRADEPGECEELLRPGALRRRGGPRAMGRRPRTRPARAQRCGGGRR